MSILSSRIVLTQINTPVTVCDHLSGLQTINPAAGDNRGRGLAIHDSQILGHTKIFEYGTLCCNSHLPPIVYTYSSSLLVALD